MATLIKACRYMIRIGTRKSPLALYQAQCVASALSQNGVDSTIVTIETSGDKCQSRPLYEIGGKSLFVKELQIALLNNDIDIAVHSLKDCETTGPEPLEIVSVLARGAPGDVFIYPENFNTEKSFTLGSSAPRRMAFSKALFPNANFVTLRGSVQTRLDKVSNGVCDTTILAHAGLERLNLLHDGGIVDYDTLRWKIIDIVPAACQGIIAMECRKNDEISKTIAKKINHSDTWHQSQIERYFIDCIGGNCRTAVGAYAKKVNNHVFCLTVMYWHDILKIQVRDFCEVDTTGDWKRHVKALSHIVKREPDEKYYL